MDTSERGDYHLLEESKREDSESREDLEIENRKIRDYEEDKRNIFWKYQKNNICSNSHDNYNELCLKINEELYQIEKKFGNARFHDNLENAYNSLDQIYQIEDCLLKNNLFRKIISAKNQKLFQTIENNHENMPVFKGPNLRGKLGDQCARKRKLVNTFHAIENEEPNGQTQMNSNLKDEEYSFEKVVCEKSYGLIYLNEAIDDILLFANDNDPQGLQFDDKLDQCDSFFENYKERLRNSYGHHSDQLEKLFLAFCSKFKNQYRKEILNINKANEEEINSLEAEIKALKEDNRVKNAKINLMQIERDNAAKEYQFLRMKFTNEIMTYSIEELNSLSSEILNKDIYNENDPQIELKLKDPRYLEFLRAIDKRIPDATRLYIDYIPNNHEDVKYYLEYYFPEKVEGISFNYGSNETLLLDNYVKELVSIAPKVQKHMELHNFVMSQDDLMALLPSIKHLTWLSLKNGKLSVPSVPDFGYILDGSKLTGLSLSYLNKNFFANQGRDSSEFENLIEGLSKSGDFKSNLETILVHQCGRSKKEIQDILSRHGFEKVYVVEI
ncbi:unnamed protein product [Moneuplotes crassus]|uniref:Uncharacterized protein n=1 Tax=Euplotes crassus TaxID=5936 RepID=A0AAD1X568_EUPCR|nr:unnamed protein product [Moneuplotes crassus]